MERAVALIVQSLCADDIDDPIGVGQAADVRRGTSRAGLAFGVAGCSGGGVSDGGVDGENFGAGVVGRD